MTLTGTARKSQSVISFNANTADTTSGDTVQTAKRLRTDNTVNIPAIAVTTEDTRFNQHANTTTRNEPLNMDEDNRNIIKLNRLLDKKDRYESHVSFLKNCLKIGRVPNGLVINLEPSIGNHEETFRAKWYQRLQEFSLTLVSDIIEYRTKVTKETSTQINVEQESLGKSLTPDDYKEVTEALQQNSTNRKITLQQNKQKTFHQLKYHRSTPTRQANSITSNTIVQRLRDKQIPLHKRELKPETRQATTVGNKLTKPQGSRQPLTKPWNSLFKTTSKTNVRTNARRYNSRTDQRNYDYNYNNTKPHATELSGATTKEIQKLRNEIAELKADKSNYAIPKNSSGVSSQRRDTRNQPQIENTKRQETPDVTQIVTLIQTTMKTLTEFKSYFDEQQHIKQTHLGM